MEKLAELYLSRAENELVTAEVLFKASNDEKIQKETFKLEKSFTFYSSVINHSYYCIFYAAKATLISQGIRTNAPNIHLKTIQAFEKRMVRTGKLDGALLKVYKEMIVRADELLGIFTMEKKKRGKFTYKKLPQANVEPAQESIGHASFFFKNIYKVVSRK